MVKNSRIVTLFGEEEQVPEVLQVVPKPVEKTGKKQPANWKNWKAEKLYYSIGEVAGLFAVRTSNIRFWSTEFELTLRTTQKGDRLFTPKNIDELRAIHHLVKERGFTISGAKAKLSEAENLSPSNTVDLRESLLKLRNDLSIIRNKLV